MKLKKIISVILAMCLVLSIFPTLANGEITVLVDGDKVVFDQAPVIENGRTLVPVRAIFEKLGARVSYEPERKKVYAELGTRYVAFLVGADTIYTNDGGTKIDTPAKILNGRTLVPVRAVSEGFGADVSWDGLTKTVSINSNKGDNKIVYKYQGYDSYAFDRTVILKGLCAYPEILSSNQIVKDLNKKFEDGAMDYVKYLCDQPNNAATILYDNYVANGSAGAFYPAEYKRTFDITYNRGDIVSFAYHTLNGSNGDFSQGKIKNGITYNLSNGQSVTKEHIFNLNEEEAVNLVKATFNIHISANPHLYTSNASEYVNLNAKNAGFYLDDYGVVFFFPTGTILNDKTEFPTVRYDFEGNEEIFAVKNFLTRKVVEDVVEIPEAKEEEITPETEEKGEEIIQPEIKEEVTENTEEVTENTEEVTEEEIKEETKEEIKTEDAETKEDTEQEEETEIPAVEEVIYTEPVNDKEYSVSFADNLYSKMPTDRNYMISPLSIKMALGLLASGAKGDTLAQIKDVMQITTTDEYNERAKTLIDIYTNTKELKINVANSVWVNTDSVDGMEFKPQYEETVKDFYNATSGKVDNSNGVDVINDWVKTNTNRKIPSIINSADFCAALVNAVYFNGRWEHEFNKKATHQGDFADRFGKFHTIDFMRQLGRFNYSIEDSATVVELPYSVAYDDNGNPQISDDKAFSMYIIMPKFDTRIVNIEKYLNKISMKKEYIDISIPKFKTEYSTSLSDVLKMLGMQSAFTWNADFSRMSDVSMAVSDVIHKTYIDVNEEGTEAAAATAVIMKATSSLITNDPVVIKIDKPFIYVIKDKVNDEILFMGEYAFVE